MLSAHSSRRFRAAAFASLIALVPIGLYTKQYAGPLAWWVHDRAGGVVYVVFGTLLVLLVRPTLSVPAAAGAAVGMTSLVEVSQLFHGPAWETIRSCELGRLIIGTTFCWLDFPHYALGGVIGALWASCVRRWALRGEREDPLALPPKAGEGS